ncbi:pseudouridylate synthase-like protein 10 [Basidiobolus meristosporus CBS 931.73]|uniref:tRNA pseudouridine(55) synthase n=1 Tax=Basidiobolus meristosporus CBS 931.73 TaxID=1314790 RepID=A0A1Y1Y3W1_9FUNG|nr:pseudouridylate synthase-like protein 10 [Basidiobolus meristosporus CBS 931.73]|eukprot:ORX92575.1 pseudouridylate synthase-like protein 10 [Basidiobolus meristosporus CBS 931.73]
MEEGPRKKLKLSSEGMEEARALLVDHCKGALVNLIEPLFSIHCCSRCVLRYLGVKDFKVYKYSLETLETALRSFVKEESPEQQEVATEDVAKKVCVSCLGTLQYADREEFVSDIIKKVKEENYEATRFTLNVTVPSSILVRTQSIFVYLSNILKESNSTMVYTADSIADIKETFKLVLCWEVARITQMELDFNSPLKITVVSEHPETENDHIFLTQISTANLNIRKVYERGQCKFIGASRANIATALRSVSNEEFLRLGQCPPGSVENMARVQSVEMLHEPIYIGGRYFKLTRGISQTPWIINNRRMTENSVSESIGDVLKPSVRADDYKFVSAGREDADVRMIGTGRPFYLEFLNPRRITFTPEEILEFENTVNKNADVKVKEMQSILPDQTSIIKEGEETKTKSYSCLVWVSNEVTEELLQQANQFNNTEFVIHQRTPIRVLHRRAQMVRDKTIHTLCAEKLGDHLMRLKLKTEAGTYIKEFVHGDLGRTYPNFGSIVNCTADLLALDVDAVDLPWPPVRSE